jgi:hypothetical protein
VERSAQIGDFLKNSLRAGARYLIHINEAAPNHAHHSFDIAASTGGYNAIGASLATPPPIAFCTHCCVV